MFKFAVTSFAAMILTGFASAQEMPKPGPEHEILKKYVGTWELTMNAGGMESKGTVSYKMDLGGMWLSSSMECEMFGQKFIGKGMDSYDATKKKYVSVWVDSMSSSPVITEGTYDKAKKTLTMTGQGPGMDGSNTKYKSVTETPDDNTIKFTMYMGDGKEPAFTVSYKRKK
jgi:hypothetical protein